MLSQTCMSNDMSNHQMTLFPVTATRVQQHLTPVESPLCLWLWWTAPSSGSLVCYTMAMASDNKLLWSLIRNRYRSLQTDRAAMTSGCRLHEVEEAKEQCMTVQKGSWVLRASVSRRCSSDRESTCRQKKQAEIYLFVVIVVYTWLSLPLSYVFNCCFNACS